MKTLNDIVQKLDVEEQELARNLMEFEFIHYRGNLDWENIFVYKESEELAYKMLQKGFTWYFGIAAKAAANSEYNCNRVKILLLEREEEMKPNVSIFYRKAKLPNIKERDRLEKMVTVFIKKADLEKIMK